MPTYNQITALKRVQFDPAADGSAQAQAFFEKTFVFTDDSGSETRVSQPWASVSFQLPETILAEIGALAAAANNPNPES